MIKLMHTKLNFEGIFLSSNISNSCDLLLYYYLIQKIRKVSIKKGPNCTMNLPGENIIFHIGH